MQFEYTAETASGDTYTTTMEAPDKFAVYEQVRAKGHTIRSVEEKASSWRRYLSLSYLNAQFSSVKTRSKVIFARTLSSMLKAGLPSSRAFQVLVRQTSNPKLKNVIRKARGELDQGIPMHQALDRDDVFSDLFIAMVKAGEESGNLGEALHAASKQLERADELAKRIRGAMIYPAIVIAAMIGIAVLMLIYVVPTLKRTFEGLGIELPIYTRAILGASDFFVQNAFIVAAGAVAIIVGFVFGLRSQPGKRAFAWTLLHLPVISDLNQKVNGARTARTFSSLLSSGVDVVRALEITEEVVQNPFFKSALQDAQDRIQTGDSMAEIFRSHEGLYPPLFVEMVAVGEETGAVTDMLDEVADYYEQEVERGTDNLSTIVEPILMVVIGIGVGFFAISMISPIYSISSGI